MWSYTTWDHSAPCKTPRLTRSPVPDLGPSLGIVGGWFKRFPTQYRLLPLPFLSPQNLKCNVTAEEPHTPPL